MEPALLARELRRIATAINNSSMPSRKAVYQDIKRLIHTLAAEGGDKTPAASEGAKSAAEAVRMIYMDMKKLGMSKNKIQEAIESFAEHFGNLNKNQIREALGKLEEKA